MIRMLALALAGALCLTIFSAAPAQVQPAQITPPVDAVARAKFPTAPGRLIDALSLVNAIVNASIQSMSDQEHYGVPDLWVQFPADMKGDCEDYALTKMGILQRSGLEAVTHARIRHVLVGEEGHAILEIRLPDETRAFLDNRFSKPMTRKELEAAGYQFFDWWDHA